MAQKAAKSIDFDTMQRQNCAVAELFSTSRRDSIIFTCCSSASGHATPRTSTHPALAVAILASKCKRIGSIATRSQVAHNSVASGSVRVRQRSAASPKLSLTESPTRINRASPPGSLTTRLSLPKLGTQPRSAATHTASASPARRRSISAMSGGISNAESALKPVPLRICRILFKPALPSDNGRDFHYLRPKLRGQARARLRLPIVAVMRPLTPETPL